MTSSIAGSALQAVKNENDSELQLAQYACRFLHILIAATTEVADQDVLRRRSRARFMV